MTTLYHRASGGGVKQWSAWIEDGNVLVRQYGIRGNNLQTVRDPKRSKGKEGTKAFKTPEQVAQEDLERQIQKKKDEGYVEDINEVIDAVGVHREAEHVSDVKLPFDFNNPPKSFAPAKPFNSYLPDLAKLDALAKQGRLWFQRKRNGNRHFIFIGDQRTTIWTRRMENATGKFPDVVAAVEAMRARTGGMINNTVLDAEFCVDVNGRDDLYAVGSVCRSDDAKAIRNQAGLDCFFMVFDVLYYAGRAIFSQSYFERYEYAKVLVAGLANCKVRVVENLEGITFENAIETIESNGWEGLVAWDPSKGSAVQLNGKPKRCNSWKVKSSREDDFVAVKYELGSSKFSDVVGALHIAQYKDGELVSCGKVGSGFDESTRLEALRWNYPCVVQVKYAERTPDGSLVFPVFQRTRFDKALTECVLPSDE